MQDHLRAISKILILSAVFTTAPVVCTIVFHHVFLLVCPFTGLGGPHVTTTHDIIGQSQITWSAPSLPLPI